MCLLLNHRETFRVAETFFSFLERLVALVRPQIFVSRTLEKLGRTLEPCSLGMGIVKVLTVLLLLSILLIGPVLYRYSYRYFLLFIYIYIYIYTYIHTHICMKYIFL